MIQSGSVCAEIIEKALSKTGRFTRIVQQAKSPSHQAMQNYGMSRRSGEFSSGFTCKKPDPV